jgi:hypothetical protein
MNKSMESLMSKDEWVARFAKALTLLYSKHLTPRMARAVATRQWPQLCSIAPDVAARRWAAQANAETP